MAYAHTYVIPSTPPHVISIFDSWLPHIDIASNIGSNSEMSSPPCQSPLPPVAVPTSSSIPATSISKSEVSYLPLHVLQDPTLLHEDEHKLQNTNQFLKFINFYWHKSINYSMIMGSLHNS